MSQISSNRLIQSFMPFVGSSDYHLMLKFNFLKHSHYRILILDCHLLYFSKVSISKLALLYYTCLYKLFKFNFTNLSILQIKQFLSTYNLLSFEHKILQKLSFFVFNIKNNLHSPETLKECLRPAETNHTYSLRASTKSAMRSLAIKTKYGEWLFAYFLSKFFNNCNINKQIFYLKNFSDFKSFFYSNFDIILSNFLKNFQNSI